ncbi:S1 family peptidase [Patulibacter defluvii]|uniref:S1 family peptidase n=1 Tax=Patulibacter defluvii TaxID=3095358 RepID=UPI002A74D885|nr:S1 family peptidase [Patulibacter sp. DM4]
MGPFHSVTRRATLGMTAVALAAGPAVTSADAQEPEPITTIAPFEIDSYVKQANITPEEARLRLEDQRKLPALTAAAKQRLGDRYGGIYVDNDADDRITIVTAPGDTASAKRAAQDAAGEAFADANLRRPGAVVEGSTAERSREALQQRIDEDLKAVNRSAPVTVDVEPDVKTGRLRLLVPVNATPEQRAFADDATERYGLAIIRAPKTAALQRTGCSSGAWCDPPLRGGIRLIYAGAGRCSSGFVVRSLSDNKRYLSTAGHCIYSSGFTGTWSTHFADGSSHDVGAPHNWANDVAILKINNVAGWSPGPYIRIQSNQTYRISANGFSSVGMRVCMTAGFTDSNCGTVTGHYATRDGTPSTYRASYCNVNGDSGGAVFADNTAFGSNVGFYHACDSVYLASPAFDPLLNVAPLT